MAPASARTALEVGDWRRRVHALYGRVREESDPATAHALWRGERDRLMAEHPATPMLAEHRSAFTGLRYGTYDPAWRFVLPILDAGPARFEFATATDGVVGFERVGVVEIPDAGTLDVWRLTSYGGGIFVPLRDGLAGRVGGTYGGGRYLLDTVKGADLGADAASGTLVLDLNFAYNPSCAYDPAWACPLAPAGNVTRIDIPVGELHG